MAEITTIGVIGSGTMGGGIVQVCAQAGYRVVVYDVQDAFLQRAMESLRSTFGMLVGKGKLTAADSEATLERIVASTDLADLAPCQFVIEAAPESIELKRDLFGKLDALCDPATIFASNTSSLSITAIGAATSRPEQVVGMHFFNPAPLLKLVEVVAGQYTSAATIEATVALARKLGKTPVRVKDTPGFIVNRVARPFYGESLRLLGEQTADVATLDRIIEQEGGFRMGPFRLMDLIGIDINFAVTQSVFASYFGEARYRPHPIQQRMVEAGTVGRKTGRGFYDYREEDK